MTLTSDYLKMAVCLAFGSFVASTPALFALPEAWVFIWGYGAIFALPTFVGVLVLYAVFRKRIQARPNLWCVAAPFAVTAGVMAAIYAVFLDLYSADQFIAGFVFLGSVAAAALFRIWVLFPQELKKRQSLQNG